VSATKGATGGEDWSSEPRRARHSCNEGASGEGIVYSAIPVKKWAETLPSAEQVRPGVAVAAAERAAPWGAQSGPAGAPSSCAPAPLRVHGSPVPFEGAEKTRPQQDKFYESTHSFSHFPFLPALPVRRRSLRGRRALQRFVYCAQPLPQEDGHGANRARRSRRFAFASTRSGRSHRSRVFGGWRPGSYGSCGTSVIKAAISPQTCTRRRSGFHLLFSAAGRPRVDRSPIGRLLERPLSFNVRGDNDTLKRFDRVTVQHQQRGRDDDEKSLGSLCIGVRNCRQCLGRFFSQRR